MDTRLTESTMVGLFVGGILGGFVADRVGRLSYYQNDSKSLILFFFRKNGLIFSVLAMMLGTIICFGVRFMKTSTAIPFILLYIGRVLMQSFEVKKLIE